MQEVTVELLLELWLRCTTAINLIDGQQYDDDDNYEDDYDYKYGDNDNENYDYDNDNNDDEMLKHDSNDNDDKIIIKCSGMGAMIIIIG